MNTYDAIVVVSFGGPQGPDDVMEFLGNVTRGRNVPPERLAEVAEQYQQFGGVSPITEQNRALIAELEAELAAHDIDLPIYFGNRNWHPYLTDTLAQMRDDGVGRALAFVTSAWSSYSACRQYLEDIERARGHVGDDAPVVDKIRQFFDHPGFVEPLAANLRAAMSEATDPASPDPDNTDPASPDPDNTDPASPDPDNTTRTRVVFCAHSIPTSMAATCDYEQQMHTAARLVAERAGVTEFDIAWQSRSGPPSVPWLGPDIGDHIEALAAGGTRAVVAVPLGFISDHMEVIYDLDTLAAERAGACGVRFVRVPTVGTNPQFVSMIRELIEERFRDDVPRRGLSELAIRPDQCAPGCCPAPSRGR